MKHNDLEVWKESVNLTKEIYLLTKDFPESEIYGLTSQMKRAAISIPSNIAEGAARNTDKDFIRFLYIASGSLAELETQIIIAKEIDYLKDLNIITKVEKVRKMLFGLIKYLKEKK